MKRDPITDEQLCALAKRGDADAQNLLIENNLRFIKKTAYEVWSAQAELNRSLQISLDDLVQEGSLGLLGCIDSYNPDSGNLFLTYAGSAIRNAMIDYIRSQNVPFEAKNLNSMISLDELAKDEVQSKHNFIVDPTKQTPEQIYLAQERHDDIHRALEMIEAREERYLRYRFGFDDEKEHPLTETAKRFHLSESRAKKTEVQALDNVWLELPWWYEQRRTFLLASIIEAWVAVSKKIDDLLGKCVAAAGFIYLLRPRRCSTASVSNLRFPASPTPEERISASLPCLQIFVLLLPQETVCPVR